MLDNRSDPAVTPMPLPPKLWVQEDVLPAALVARKARYCRLCVPVPTQRRALR